MSTEGVFSGLLTAKSGPYPRADRRHDFQAAVHVDVTKTAVAQSDWGMPIYRISGSLTNLVLEAGEYWVTLAPIGQGTGSGQWWILRSTGANAVGDKSFDGLSYWDSSWWDKQWMELRSTFPGETDFSLGVSGTPVPEPSSILALLCGVGGIGGLAMRRRLA